MTVATMEKRIKELEQPISNMLDKYNEWLIKGPADAHALDQLHRSMREVFKAYGRRKGEKI